MTRSVSRARLGRLSRHLDAYVAAKKIPCAMCLVTMHGDEAYYHESGLCDVERNVEVSRDTIFRIYSMTKPITSVALMMLYEEGHFQLDDPVAEYIPSWGRLRVYQSGKGESIATREAVNAMTVKNLLTHTSGLTYGFMQSHPVDAVYRSERIGGGPGRTLQDTVDALAATPLLYDPGTRWHYSVSTDICGYLVQLFSGQDLDDFIHDRICRPLGMADTAFRVPEATRHRLAACYSHSDSGYRLQDDPIKSTYFERPTFLSGGGGMVSTVDDYTRFALMLLNKGILDGERVLGSKTVEYMTTNPLAEECRSRRNGPVGFF